MKDLIIPVNNEAHSRALEAIVGPESAQLVLKAYKAIDAAMVFGYERGIKEREDRAVVEAASASEENFKAGFDAGYDDAVEGKNDDYDDGYVDGVSDARTCPAEADAYVASLCAEDAAEDQPTFEGADWA